MKIIFFGTPEVAVPFLRELDVLHDVVCVVTQPDRRSGRGQEVHFSQVKTLALEKNIKVIQPEQFTPEVIEEIKNLKADIGVVVAYGRLIPEAVYLIPKLGCFNIHFSLLPKYRGAAPVQWALINGETETGVTTFFIEKTLDSGPIISQKTLQILPDDNAESLFAKLIPLGLFAMCQSLTLVNEKGFSAGSQTGEPTFAPSLHKDKGMINWSKSAFEIENLVRGLNPKPGAYTVITHQHLKNHKIKILKAKAVNNCSKANVPEAAITEIIKNTGFVVQCGSGQLRIDVVHPENKKQMSAWSFLQGGHYKAGDKIF